MKVKLSRKKEVYDFCQPYIIAEIGSNHNGDMKLAKKIISAAKKCGCDAVKFQSWDTKSLFSKEEYERSKNSSKTASLYEQVETYYLRPLQHKELKDYCKKIAIDFCSTPFSEKEVDLLNNLGVTYFKIASMDINNLELLKYVAKFNKPVLLSTGMSSLAEIEKAVKTIEGQGNKKIVILHCIAVYPPKYTDINLNNILMLKGVFGYPVGFSDHSIGYSIPLAAITLGACVIEKHFTLDKDLPGWDHQISANPKEMEVIVEGAKQIVKALGSLQRVISTDEENKRLSFRRSLVAGKDLKRGSIISKKDLLAKRPGTGISPDQVECIIGRTLKRNISYDGLILWNDLA